MNKFSNGYYQLVWWGRFGNRMFQYAFGASNKINKDVKYYTSSDWEGSYIFKNQYHDILPKEILERVDTQKKISSWRDVDLNKRVAKDYGLELVTEYKGYHEKFTLRRDVEPLFDPEMYKTLWRKQLQNYIFDFSDELKNENFYKYFKDREGTYDVVNLRRMEITHLNFKDGYSVIPDISYKRACRDFGINYDECMIISDDISLSTNPFKNLITKESWEYPKGVKLVKPQKYPYFIYDFLAIVFARNVILGNSSFSWWAGCLNKNGKVYTPVLETRPEKFKDTCYVMDCMFEEGLQNNWVVKNLKMTINE